MSNKIIDPASVAMAALGGMTPRLVPAGGDLLAARPPNDRARIVDITSPLPGDPTPLREWGDAVRMPQGSQQDIDEDDRQDMDPGWGRREIIKFTQGPQQLARVILTEGEFLQYSVDVLVPPGVGTLTGGAQVPLTVWASVDFGAGAASAKRLIRCDDHVDGTLAVCFLSISVYIGDLQGNPVTSQAFLGETLGAGDAQVAVQVARGTRGLPYVNSQFIETSGSAVQVVATPVRALSMAFNLVAAPGADRFIQVLDVNTAVTPLVVGVTVIPPSMLAASFPLGTTPSPGVKVVRLNPQGFSQGIFVYVAATPVVPNPFLPSGDVVHIEVEKLLL